MGRELLGELEQLVLLATVRLGDDAYGTSIREEIEEHTHKSIAIGSLYKTLDRLSEKGMIQSKLGASTPERGGRAKRFFCLTPLGIAALRESVRAINAMASGLVPSLEAS